MSFEDIVYGWTDGRMHGHTTVNGQNVITKAHLVTTTGKLKIGLKSLQEYSADINRQHFQMQVFLAF